MTSIKPTFLALAVVLALAAGCGKKSSADDSDDAGSPPVPTSPGAKTEGVVTLSFAAAAPAGLALTGSLDLGSGLVLDSAKLNIGRIKMKSDKDATEGEIALEGELEQKENDIDEMNAGSVGSDEQQLGTIEAKYDGLLASADSQAKKDALEQQEQDEKNSLEQSIADDEGTKENDVDAIEDAQDDSLKWKETYVFDAITNLVTPEIPAISLGGGEYRRIEFKIRPSRSTTENLELLNHSAVFAGSVKVGATAVPFEFKTRSEMQLSLKGQGALAVDSTQENKLVVAFDAASWFAGVNLAGGTVGPRGVIEIDEATNASLYAAIVRNIKLSTSFGEDQDGDGQLGDGEFEGDGGEQVAQEDASH